MLTLSVKNKFESYRVNSLDRHRRPIDARDDTSIYLDQKNLINFSSNDYLGLSTHPFIKDAFIEGVRNYGFGSGSSAMISGYFEPQRKLEDKFAEYLGRDRAILFNSGYHANLGVIQAIANRHSSILSDRLCHASIMDGIQLSRAKHVRYQHCDVNHVNHLIKKNSSINLIITESVFSMEGDIAPIAQLAKIAQENHALLMVDDAHGIGVIGNSAKGICDYTDITSNDIDCLITPLGKAVGSIGALVSGNEELMEIILQFARTYTYTTALPPAVVVAILASFEIMQAENWRRDKLQSIIKFFIKHAEQRNILLNSKNLTPIKTIIIGDNQKVIMLQNKLISHGFFVAGIRSPTVPAGTARIRISLNCNHHESDIERLLDLLYDYHK